MTRSVLVISPSFPPYQGSQTQRILAITEALIDSGFKVSVLTTEILEGHPGYNKDSLKLIDSRITVYRTRAGKLHRNAYSKHSELSDIKYGKTDITKKTKFKSKIYSFLNKTKTAVLFPDTMVDWYFPAVRYVNKKIIHEINPDFIFSCSMPNTCHLIGYKLSRKYHIPLIMDYSDPWVYIAGYSHGKARFFIERFVEKKILKYSQLVSFTTKGAEQLYIQKFGLNKYQTVTALTGFDSSLLSRSSSYEPKKHNGIIMIYGGAIQEGVRDPRPFFQALELVDGCINCVIRTDDCNRVKQLASDNCKKEIVTIDGYVPFDLYYKEMLDSDILVFFGNSTSDQLPGKIFNYISTGKLIFYISNVPDGGSDQAIDIIRDYGYCVVAKNDVESILKGFNEAFLLLQNKPSDIYDRIDKYCTTKQMKMLTDKIKSLNE